MSRLHLTSIFMLLFSLVVFILAYNHNGMMHAYETTYAEKLGKLLSLFQEEAPKTDGLSFSNEGLFISEFMAIQLLFLLSGFVALLSSVMAFIHRFKFGYSKMYPALSLAGLFVIVFLVKVGFDIGLYGYT